MDHSPQADLRPPVALPQDTAYLRRGFRGSIVMVLTRVIGGGAGILYSIYTVRLLSADEYATLVLLKRFLPFAVVITSFGLNASLLRFVPELLQKGANAALRKLLATIGAIRIPAIFTLCVVLIAAYSPLARALNFPESMRPVLPLVVAYLMAMLLNDFLSHGVLAAFLDQTFYLPVNTIMVGGYTAATIWSLKNGYGLKGVMWSQVVFLSLGLFMLIARTGTQAVPILRGTPGTAIDVRSRVSRFAGFSLLIAAGSLLRSASVDVFVISAYLSYHEVALYGFASGIMLMGLSYTPMMNMGTILTPILAREYSRAKDPDKLVLFFGLTTKLVAYTSLPILVGTCLFLPQLITDVYRNPMYLPSVTVSYFFLIFVLFRSFMVPFAVLYSALERPEYTFYGQLIGLLNVILLLVLIPRFGIIGAAAATSLLAPVSYLYHWLVFRWAIKIGLGIPWKTLVRFVPALLISTAMAVVLRTYLDGMFQVAAGLVAYAILYFILAHLCRPFDERERSLLLRAMGRWSRLL